MFLWEILEDEACHFLTVSFLTDINPLRITYLKKECFLVSSFCGRDYLDMRDERIKKRGLALGYGGYADISNSIETAIAITFLVLLLLVLLLLRRFFNYYTHNLLFELNGYSL